SESPGRRLAASAAVVFPGPNRALERAIGDGRIPDTSVALIFEAGQWRRARPAAARSGVGGEKIYRRRGVQNFVDRRLGQILTRFRTNMSLRRLQPSLDGREADVLATLLDPGDYPYRLKRIVEGRVLLAIGTLDAGGAERQVINTAQGLRARGVSDVHILTEYLDPASGQDFHLQKAKEIAASVILAPDHSHVAAPWAVSHPRFRDVLTDGLVSRVLNVASAIKQLAPEVVHISLDWPNITVGIAAVLTGVPNVFVSGRNLNPVHFEFFQSFMYPCYRALSRCP